MFRCFAALAVAAGAMGLTAPESMALAQSEMGSACRSDYLKHCAGVMPGGGRIIGCLAARMPELSPDCRRAVALGEACREDFKRLCDAAQASGGDAAVACLQSRAGQLTKSCREALSTAAGR